MEDDPPLPFAARGWSMRRGHRKGLEARNLRVQPGSSAGLGRSAVKRSVNRSSRRLEREENMGRKGKTRNTLQLVMDGCSEHREQKHQELVSTLQSCEVHLETFMSFEHAPLQGIKKDSWKGEDSEVASTCSGSDSQSDISMHLHLQSCRSPWEAAVLRASLVASCYKVTSAETKERDPSKKESQKEKVLLTKEQSYLAELSKEYSVKFTYDLEEDPACRFEKFRSEFFYKNASHFLKQLQPLYSAQPQSPFFRLRPAPISRTVQKKFLQTLVEKEKSHQKSMLAFHGTDHSALGHIYSDGLVVPGLDNNVKVRNGSAFGRGIYAGHADCAATSWSYARGLARPMLVCAAWDGPAEEVAHHGSFHVFKTNDNVVPLFEASFVAGQNCLPAPSLPPKPKPKPKRIIVVEPTKPKGPGPKTRLPKLSSAPAVVIFLSRRASSKRRGTSWCG